MRKRRVIIYDDEPVVLLVLRDYFELKGYEILAFREPVICPIYSNGARCAAPCADVMLTDRKMPGRSGIELLQEQARRGCLLHPGNKALLTGHLEEEAEEQVRSLGAMCFEKPLEFHMLDHWLEDCEQRMDLEHPLAVMRKEARQDCGREVRFHISGHQDELRGTAVNLSRSGICLRSPVPLREEETVTFRTELPLISPVALVRWVLKAADGASVAGLQCVAAH